MWGRFYFGVGNLRFVLCEKTNCVSLFLTQFIFVFNENDIEIATKDLFVDKKEI